jgi:signal transduction histidine kinase
MLAKSSGREWRSRRGTRANPVNTASRARILLIELRRAIADSSAEEKPTHWHVADLEIDLTVRRVTRAGKALRAVGEAALRPDAGDPKSLREALSSMLEETRRLSDLVDALLLLAREERVLVEVQVSAWLSRAGRLNDKVGRSNWKVN